MTRVLRSIGLAVSLLAGLAAGVEPSPAADPSTSAEGPATAQCGPDRALEVAARVQARYDAIADLSARFEQTSRSVVLSGAAMGGDLASRGEVVFAKPGKMRWSYVEPEPSLVVSDGKIMWIYDETARQATRMPVAQEYLAGAALQFLLGQGSIVESFRIEAVACTDEVVELQLLPRKPASYEMLGLSAEVESGLVRETTLVDLFGNRTRIRFEGILLDQHPAASLFVFDPPDGVEVIDLELSGSGVGP